MRVAAVFVIDNPNVEDLSRNILNVIDDVEVIILWFNTECNISFDNMHELFSPFYDGIFVTINNQRT